MNPSSAPTRLLNRALSWWEANLIRHPWFVVVFFIVACGLTLKYTLDHLKVNTNTADMISTEVPFQKNRIRLENAFPQDIGTALLLIEGETPESTSAAVSLLANLARKHTEAFSNVYVPDEGAFFGRNGLLYLTKDQLDDLTEQLANAQPFIGRIAEDNTLRGFFRIVGDALTEKDQSGLAIELNPILKKINASIGAAIKGEPYRLSWRELMTPTASGLGITKRFIFVKPILHYDEVMPAEQALDTLHQIISEVHMGSLANVNIRMTGEVALEHEEMQTISSGVSIAGIASLIMVCLTLWFAYRSAKLMIATFISLTMGLIFSLGFATLAIGQLNLISIGFAVLFIGMGDAYSSHFCLRYRELIQEGKSARIAIQDTMTSTGSALVLSAITAAIGLYAYIPTRYSGVAELGIIAGTSMFIALITTFTVLPALIRILPIHPPKEPEKAIEKKRISTNWPLVYAKPIRYASVFLALLSLGLLFKVKVDFNPLNLRDPNTESVQTFKHLLESKDTSPMTLASLANSIEEIDILAEKFNKLPLIDKVVSIKDLIPEDQEEKLSTISDISLLMGTKLTQFPAIGKDGLKSEVVHKFHGAILEAQKKDRGNAQLNHLEQTLATLESSLNSLDPDGQINLLNEIQTNLLSLLPSVIADLGESLSAEPITQSSLPKELVERWVSPDGLYRLQIFPKENLDNVDNLRSFILEAQQVDPNVTDLPVTYLESMNEVIIAFQEAFAIAFTATAIILLLVLRNVKDTLLVLLPLVLASLFTAATTVVMNIPFNFANIIALPLLFGLGVDSGIHMAHRLHYLESHQGELLATSEAKGVFYGALTTVFSFSSLAFTSHQGTASMGLLLSVGLMFTLICALVVLPAFSNIRIQALKAH